MKISFTALSAACILAALAAPSRAASLCGDVNINESVTSADALLVLKKSVGQSVQLTCPDFINRYGHPADTNLNSEFSKDFLLGQQITIEYPATITHLGVIARESGTMIRLALYADDGGEPAGLIVATDPTEVKVGTQEIPVAATPVAAGDYWIMGLYNLNTFMGTDEAAPSGNIVKYRSLVWGSPLPDPFGVTITYDETIINYWAKVQQ